MHTEWGGRGRRFGYFQPMDLDAYFARIAYGGSTDASHETLDALMRAHAAAIPFENLDVQLGRPVTRDPAAIFAKLVENRRGGWCYEQNGLLGRALESLGFEVMRIAGGVMRVESGDSAIGNHLALVVQLDRPWLADVGFGGSLAAPIPLAAGAHAQAPYALALIALDDGHWRFEERAGGKPFSFDFQAAPADPAMLDRHQAWLQSDPSSPFVQNLVVQRRLGDSHLSLRGRVLTEMGAGGDRATTIADADALVATLHERFGLDVSEIAACWPAICARHEGVFGASEG